MDLISEEVLSVMARLEELDAADRLDGTPQWDRLRAVSPEVGRFLHSLVLATAARTVVECGTSAGYSSLWLASAVIANHGRLVTFEVDPRKLELARRSFADAGVGNRVELRDLDAREGLTVFDRDADLVFLDVEKELYEPLLEPIVRALRPGGVLVADNLRSHEADLADFREAALGHPRLTGLVVPIGRGELLAVKSLD